jgi:hypothetical protein
MVAMMTGPTSGACTAIVALTATVGWSTECLSATLRVPSEFATINAGLDASAAGDTVLVAPGTYTDSEERVIDGSVRTACAFLVDGVFLQSEQGAKATAIDMQGQGGPQPNVMYGDALDSGNTVVEGFTITGSPTGRSGVRLNESETVTFRDCIFRDLDGGIGSGGGLIARNTDVDVFDCEFRNCRAAGGGGIFQNGARMYVSGCSFIECHRGIDVIGDRLPEQVLVIENSIFLRNYTVSGSSAAVFATDYGDERITGCRFEDNTSFNGSAVSVGGVGALSGPHIVEDCIFWKNRTTLPGSGAGALRVGGGTGSVTSNTFVENEGTHPLAAGAVEFQSGNIQFMNNIIAGSRGGVGLRVLSGTQVTGGCNVFWDNPDGNAIGYILTPTDREVDPLFCVPETGDFTLSVDSPCLPEHSKGCGLIGALGRGCELVSVRPGSWGRIKAAYRGQRNDRR